MKKIFITATGTSIGKTHIASNLAAELYEKGCAVEVLKPVVSDWSGYAHSDTGILLTAVGKTLSEENIDRCSPWRFKAKLGADLAAKEEGTVVDFKKVVEYCKKFEGDYIVIEGAGGVMSPIAPGKTNLDLIEKLKISSVLVSGSYLGAITHLLTAIEAMKAKDCKPKYIVITESEDSIGLEAMEESIRPLVKIPYLFVPRNSRPSLANLMQPKIRKA